MVCCLALVVLSAVVDYCLFWAMMSTLLSLIVTLVLLSLHLVAC